MIPFYAHSRPVLTFDRSADNYYLVKALLAIILLLPFLGSCAHMKDVAGLADCSTRAASAKALADRKDPNDIPTLIEALNPGAAGVDCSSNRAADPTPAVAAAVASYGSAAVDPLLQALKKNATKGGAAMALADLGDKRAVEPLIIELRTALIAGYQVEPAVMAALGRLGDDRAEPFLRQAAERPTGYVDPDAAKALAALKAPRDAGNQAQPGIAK
jgi:HEAT repeat protein